MWTLQERKSLNFSVSSSRVKFMNTDPFCVHRRPAGSEATVLITNSTQVKSQNSEHIGGYALVMPILSGIESKLGLVFPQTRDEVIQRLK